MTKSLQSEGQCSLQSSPASWRKLCSLSREFIFSKLLMSNFHGLNWRYIPLSRGMLKYTDMIPDIKIYGWIFIYFIREHRDRRVHDPRDEPFPPQCWCSDKRTSRTIIGRYPRCTLHRYQYQGSSAPSVRMKITTRVVSTYLGRSWDSLCGVRSAMENTRDDA